jgi:arginyl-tRNA synthetase
VWVRYQQALGRDVHLTRQDYGGEYLVELAQELGALAAPRIMHWIETDLERARVRFDNWFSEARIIREGDFQRMLDLLKECGLVYEREGAVWPRSEELGDDRDRVLIKSDGRPTYTATDIAYHYDKFFVRAFDRVIDVWGSDHEGQVKSMKAIVKNLGDEPERFDVLINQMVNVVRDGQVLRMHKREGNLHLPGRGDG